MKSTRTILFLLLFVFVSACNSMTPTPTISPTVTLDTSTLETSIPEVTAMPTETPTLEATATPEAELPEVPEGYKLFDLNQFPTFGSFLDYSAGVCAPSRTSLGSGNEAKLLAKAIGLPEKFLWDPAFIDYWVKGTGYDGKCGRLYISTEPEMTGDPDTAWGRWLGTVKIVFLITLDGEAERYIYYPQK